MEDATLDMLVVILSAGRGKAVTTELRSVGARPLMALVAWAGASGDDRREAIGHRPVTFYASPLSIRFCAA